MKVTTGDVVRVAVIGGCIIGGIVLRLQSGLNWLGDGTAPILGGGLIVIGIVLFAYWAKRPPRP